MNRIIRLFRRRKETGTAWQQYLIRQEQENLKYSKNWLHNYLHPGEAE